MRVLQRDLVSRAYLVRLTAAKAGECAWCGAADAKYRYGWKASIEDAYSLEHAFRFNKRFCGAACWRTAVVRGAPLRGAEEPVT